MATEKNSPTQLVFTDFNSIDLILLYPRFPSTIIIAGTALSRQDAMDTWAGYHGVGVKNKPSPYRPYKTPVPRYKQNTPYKICTAGMDVICSP